MLIDIASPASLPLCLTGVDADGVVVPALLAATVQHPPIQLQASVANDLSVTGPRADLALEQAATVRSVAGHARGAVIEIELAIPQYMGLGSNAMMGLTMARVLAWTNESDGADMARLARAAGLQDHDAAAVWGFDAGGLIAVEFGHSSPGELPRRIRRAVIKHPERDAWAFVLFLPRTDDLTPTAAPDWWPQWRAAAERLDLNKARQADARLWQAAEADDLDGFARVLSELQALTEAARAAVGAPLRYSDRETGVFEVMRANEALAVGRSMGGLAQWALVRGAEPTQRMRPQIQHHVGYEAGRAMATIVDNRGAYHIEKKDTLRPTDSYSIRPRKELGTSDR